MINANNLTKAFNGNLAVDGLDLEINQGEVFGILGPNGAGKTTTVRMLACLIAPTSGGATVAGYEVGRQDAEVRRITGLLTESPGLYERFSASWNLDFYGRLYEMSAGDRERHVKKYLDLLGLWDRRDEPVGRFSKGMRQRVAIARALLHEPKVLYLDEPTSGLDPEAARTVRDFIENLKEEGRTIVLCTHNLDEADRLCDRVAVFKRRAIKVDTPADLKRQIYGRQVEVRLRSLTEPVLEAVRSLPFVKEMERVDSRIVVGLSNPEEQNPALVARIVAVGGEIQFVNELSHSLEEVYFSLIGGGSSTESERTGEGSLTDSGRAGEGRKGK